jgi:predicted transposase YdaD
MSLGLPMATVERLHVEGRARKGRMDFKYEVIRLWEQPVRRFLTGGLGTLPLAPLCRLPGDAPLEEGLKPVVRRIAERLQREASSGDQAKLLTAAYILTGLRVSQRAARNLFEGVRAMQESTTYQAILEEGQAKGQTLALQKTLLRQGPQRFGLRATRCKRRSTPSPTSPGWNG